MPISPEFWEREKNNLLSIIKPRLIQAAFVAMSQGAVKAGILFEAAIANAAAAQWAEGYTDKMLSDIMQTTVTGVGNAVAEYVRGGMTIGDLQARLEPLFGASRASRISVTEVTRAFAEGEYMTYTQKGIKRWRWNTNHDGIVCKICRPLHGRVVEIGNPFGYTDGKTLSDTPIAGGRAIIKPPDAHPGDRCWVSPVVDL